MPVFSITQRFAFPRDILFAFFCRPANVVAVAPPELNLQVVEAPVIIDLGSRIVVQMRHWGLSQRMVTEVVELQPDRLIVEEQRQGPFRVWRHERHFVVGETPNLMEVAERITYEPPGGMLGLFATPTTIEASLLRAYLYREEVVNTLLRAQH